MITGKYPSLRLRRGRKYSWTRRLTQENTLSSSDFILPIFIIEGSNKKEPINTKMKPLVDMILANHIKTLGAD